MPDPSTDRAVSDQPAQSRQATTNESEEAWKHQHRKEVLMLLREQLHTYYEDFTPRRKEIARRIALALIDDPAAMDVLSVGVNAEFREQTRREQAAYPEAARQVDREQATHRQGSVMSDNSTQRETELRIQLAEAQTDKKFADMLGEMRTGFAKIDARIDGLERATAGIKPTVIGTGIAAVAVVIAMLAYGQTWFGIGVSTRDVVKAAVAEYRQQTAQPTPGQGTP